MTLQPGQLIARGVCRWFLGEGFAPVTEFAPARGLRADVTALARDGEIWVVECKSSRADFLSDAKWSGYLDWCDRFFFAGPPELAELFPDEHGLIAADGYGAEVLRPSPLSKLPAARRKSQTQRLARVAALRLQTLTDPGASAFASDREE
ncbi:MAG: MmcB family DNA repair protein [Pseudomonadota bacterium]